MSGPLSPTAEERAVAEASEWVVLSEERPLTDGELAAFEAWKVADPRNETAYRNLLRTWDAIGALDADALRKAAGPVVVPFSERRTPWRRWRASAVAAAVAATAAVVLVAIPMLTAPQTIRSADALRIMTLPDGSRVTLGPNSKLKVLFADETRKVELVGGEAFFEVTKNPARPFEVAAGDAVVRVLGTKFDVNRGRGAVRVSVLEGRVNVRQLADGARSASTVELGPGQRTEAAATERQTLRVLPATAPGAWREGRLVYQDVRLSDLVDDLNRYYGPGIELRGGEVSGVRLTAGLKTAEIPAFMSGLSAIAPVTVTRESDGGYTVSPIAGEAK